MVASVKHTFVSPIPDGGDPTIVGPNAWNADHTLVGVQGTIALTTTGTGAATFDGTTLNVPTPAADTGITQLTGEVTAGPGNGSQAATVTNAAVIGKVLTGYVSGAGTVSVTDSILQAIQKLNGNDATNANLTGPITSIGNATTIASLATGTGLPLTTGVTGVLPIANGGTNASTAPNARLNLTIPAYVSTRTAMAALAGATDLVVVLEEANRQGTFVWNSANLSTQVTADPQQGIYVPPSSAPTGASGAWVRVYNGQLNVFWFGAVGDGTTNDVGAFSAAYTLAKTLGSAETEGPIGSIYAPGSAKYAFGSSFSVDTPVILQVDGYIEYTPTTGAAVIIGSVAPTSSHNTGYDISIAGLRATNGNTTNPTSINTSGSIGIEIRNMQFSRLRVGRVIAFTHAGIYGNATNNVYTGQQVQDNNIYCGDLAFCGVGFLAESVSASLGSFQVNWIQIQNSFANWTNLTLGKSGDINTNNNLLEINALDADTGGGNTKIWGLFNSLRAGYLNGTLTLQTNANFNRVVLGVGTSQATVVDSGSSNEIRYNNNGFYTPNTGATALSVFSDNAATSAGPNIDILRLRASPANNDGIGELRFVGNNSTPAQIAFAVIRSDVPTPGAGNENGRILFDTYLGGSYANRATIWQGLVVGSLGDKGPGTINTQAYWADVGTTTRAPINLLAGTNLTTPVAGAVEYDGKVYYATAAASSRQVVDAEQVTILSADNAGPTNVATAQNVFPAGQGTLTVQGATTYEFEAFYEIDTTGATSNSLQTLFGGTATFTAISYYSISTNGTASTTPATASMRNINVATASAVTAAVAAATQRQIKLRGTMRINAAGTIIPQFQYSSAPGAAPVVKIGSFFRCWPIGVNTVTNVGAWS